MDQDWLVAYCRARFEHIEMHASISVQQALDTVWEQYQYGLLSLQEWVDQISSFPAL